MSMQLNPLLPLWTSLPLIVALFAAIVYGAWMLRQKQVAGRWVIALTCLRLAIFAAFVLILLQPALSYSRSTPQLPELLVLVDTSKSMNRAGSQGTRLEETTAALQKGDLAAALSERFQLHWFTFDVSATPFDPTDLGKLKATGATTQYAESIDAAYRQVSALGKKPQRVLLMSDGNDRGQVDPVAMARRHGLNVDVLAPAAEQQGETPTLEIAEVQSARRVLLGSETIFRVNIQQTPAGSAEQTLRLHVTEDGKKVLDQPAVFPAGRTEQTLYLTYRPTTAGVKQYEFHLTAGAASAKPYPLAVQVLDSKYEVLILEDRWRWEYKYLHRLFEDDPSFRFSALLNRGGGAFVQFGSPDRRVNLVGFPQGRADLEGFDLFVLGDVNPAQWPRGLATDLAREVTEGGRSLIVIAGPGLAKLQEIPELHGVLPVELTPESGKPIEGPIAVRMRPDSAQSPFFFQLRAGAEGTLPPLDQIYPTLRKRPGATVLLEAPQERGEYGPQIVIAEQTVGRGRVLFVATDTLWKWHTLAQTRDGPTPYSIFWQQAFRALTPARQSVGPIQLWLTPERSRAEVGRPIAIQAEAQSSRSLPAASIQAAIVAPDDKRVPLVFAADAHNPRLFRAEFFCTQKGLHKITAALQAEGKTLADAATVLQAEEPRSEEDDAGVDFAFLARIAQDTGGRVIDPALPETWPTPGPDALPPIAQMHTIDLWNNFTLLLVLCALLGADWFLRLFKGLVAG
jgi:hypothetical protein